MPECAAQIAAMISCHIFFTKPAILALSDHNTRPGVTVVIHIGILKDIHNSRFETILSFSPEVVENHASPVFYALLN
jgi:hypothetical protein